LFYENVTWDGNIKNKIRTIYNCKHCIAVDLILKQPNGHDVEKSQIHVIYLLVEETGELVESTDLRQVTDKLYHLKENASQLNNCYNSIHCN
jgi:hypothetical protein